MICRAISQQTSADVAGLICWVRMVILLYLETRTFRDLCQLLYTNIISEGIFFVWAHLNNFALVCPDGIIFER